MRNIFSVIFVLCSGWSSLAMSDCPDLGRFYPANHSPERGPDWQGIKDRLQEIFSDCLLSSEFFALYGAAQLNTGQLPEAMESLERALLLDPKNGAALIDYSDALLRDGQLFAAIEANALLQARRDLPDELKRQIEQRRRNWSALTSQTSWQFDFLGGYDDNLNGAPDDDLITLTLSRQPILLALNNEFRAVSGPFLTARLQARHRRLSPGFQDNFQGQLRGRHSENTASDVLQVAGRFNRLAGSGRRSRQWGGGVNHLMFSSRPLFTGTDARYRFQIDSLAGCRVYLGGAMQHQIWHEQRRLDGLEAKVSLVSSCRLPAASAQRINIEAGVLHNAELNANRLGGNRDGWQLIADWQVMLPRGMLSAQLTHTRLLDGRGFSPLLENYARREIERSSLLVQYSETLRWLGEGTRLLVNLYHQDQGSNLGVFRTKDTSVEVGLSWQF